MSTVTILGASAFSVGLIEGASEATALIAKVFSGVLRDFLGKRKALAGFGYALGALNKPLFPPPRDSASASRRGVGLRQALDTVGAFTGPLLAVALMLRYADNFRLIAAMHRRAADHEQL